jgi:hypothetical protein
VSFSPTVLAFAPRPLEMELTSSWMERVATANQVSLMQLLAAFVDRYPELRCSGEVCLDCGLLPAWSRALAEWCRLDESQIPNARSKATLSRARAELVQSSSRFAQQFRVGSGISVVGEPQVLCPLHAAAGQGRSANPSADGVGASVHDPLSRAFWRAAMAALPLLPPGGFGLDNRSPSQPRQ